MSFTYMRSRAQKQPKNKSKKGHRKEKKQGDPPKVTQEQLYDAIEGKIGSFKVCNYGCVGGKSSGVKHEGSRNVDIHDFELSGISYDNDTGEIIFEEGSDGLKDYCRECSKKCRKSDITEMRNRKQDQHILELEPFPE